MRTGGRTESKTYAAAPVSTRQNTHPTTTHSALDEISPDNSAAFLSPDEIVRPVGPDAVGGLPDLHARTPHVVEKRAHVQALDAAVLVHRSGMAL